MKQLTAILFFTLFIQACGGTDDNEDSNEIKQISIPTSEGTFDGLAAGDDEDSPVILLHGFPTTAEQYTDIMAALVEEDYYVIAPNLRGFSEGVRPSNSDDYHPSIRTNDVINIADQLGIYRFHLVGHDSGALTAWIIASMHPDRVITLTAMSVAHPQAIVDDFFDPESEAAERVGYAQEFVTEGFEETFVANDHEYMRWIYEDTPEDSINLYIEKLGDVETVDAILNYYRVRDWPWILANGATSINVPTLQIWGDQDSYVSISPMERSENYVSAEYQFEILEGVSHWVTETAAEDVSHLLIEHFSDRY